MRDGWTEVPLGSVMCLDIERVPVDPGSVYDLAGVYSFGRGLFRRDPLRGSSTTYRHMYRLGLDQLVMSKLKAWEGALAVVTDEFDGSVLSPEFPTYSLRTEALTPAYAQLVIARPEFWASVAAQSRGIGGRKERVHQDRLLDVRVTLPPVSEQRRIVDLVAVVDDTSTRTSDEAAAAQSLLATLREAHIGMAGPRRGLGEVLNDIDSGVSPLTDGRAPRHDESAVLKLSAVRPGQFRPREAKALPPGTPMPQEARVRIGDVLVTRSNTPDTVGYACVVDDVRPNTYLSDLILRLHPAEGLLPDYLAEALLTRDARAQIMSSARGTSGSMRKISRGTLREVVIPVPESLDTQRTIARLLRGLAAVRDRAADEVARLAELRSMLVADLLSGAGEIPRSYDRFLPEAP